MDIAASAVCQLSPWTWSIWKWPLVWAVSRRTAMAPRVSWQVDSFYVWSISTDPKSQTISAFGAAFVVYLEPNGSSWRHLDHVLARLAMVAAPMGCPSNHQSAREPKSCACVSVDENGCIWYSYQVQKREDSLDDKSTWKKRYHRDVKVLTLMILDMFEIEPSLYIPFHSPQVQRTPSNQPSTE